MIHKYLKVPDWLHLDCESRGAEVRMRKRRTRQLLRPWCHASPGLHSPQPEDDNYIPELWCSPTSFEAPSLQAGCTMPAARTAEIRSQRTDVVAQFLTLEHKSARGICEMPAFPLKSPASSVRLAWQNGGRNPEEKWWLGIEVFHETPPSCHKQLPSPPPPQISHGPARWVTQPPENFSRPPGKAAVLAWPRHQPSPLIFLLSSQPKAISFFQTTFPTTTKSRQTCNTQQVKIYFYISHQREIPTFLHIEENSTAV